MMTDERGLHDALSRQADQLGHPHPFSLEDVQGKARGIRRRRAALSGLAAVTVLGISAPLALSLGDEATSPDRTPDVAASEPASTGLKDGVLTTQVDAGSAAPGVPYLYDGQIHLPGGDTIDVAGDWTSFATFGDGFVVADADTLNVLSADGEVTDEAPIADPGIAVSADRTLVTYVYDDAVQWIAADGSSGLGIPVPPTIQTPQLVAVSGSESCDPAHELGGCVVFLDDAGTKGGGYSLTSKGNINPVGGFRSLNDAATGGWTSGVTEYDDIEGACSEVWDDPFGEGPVWDTCDHLPTDFSPDDSLVIGAPAYRSGFGDTSIAILDAGTGEVLAEWQNSEEHQSDLTSTTWDEDGSVLGLVREGNEWALMRFAADGGLSKVMDLESDDPDVAPLVLPQGS